MTSGDAQHWGLELAYTDAQGDHQVADPDAVQRVLALLANGPAPSGIGVDHSAGATRAFQGSDDRRHWLLAVQLYGVRSERNWGHGDFSDLAALVRLASEVGAAGIGLNPLHALFPDRAEEASPYAPNSRLFLNPLYIDVAAAPGFPGIADLGLAGELERLRSSELVDYAGVSRAKMVALRAAYRGFRERPEGEDDFAAFRAEQGVLLERFAAFETLRQKFNKAWWDWPELWRRPRAEALDTLRRSDTDEIGFHEYVQWVADRQLRRCRELAGEVGCGVGLYVDLAVGVQAGGADVWAEQEDFLVDLSVGAPPDAMNREGQDWGLTTFNPHGLRVRDFAPFRELLAAAMRHAGAVRIDHILGLNRIYVIPRGFNGKRGVYLRFPLGGMLETLAQESQRRRCVVIGEDLGTVPEGFRQALSDHGIWTYIVMLFEREHDGAFRWCDRYPENALATFATHDLATLSGWLSAHDLRTKHAIGIDPGETEEQRAHAIAALRRTMMPDESSDALLAIVRCLAQGPSRLVSVSVEDVLGVQDQINIPGTVHEHPNWRRKLPVSLDAIRANRRLHDIGAIFARAGRSEAKP